MGNISARCSQETDSTRFQAIPTEDTQGILVTLAILAILGTQGMQAIRHDHWEPTT